MATMRPEQFRRRPKREAKIPICPYCDEPAMLAPGRVIYPNYQALWDRSYWWCRACNAWVGCHEGTTRPLGRLANAELRAAKQEAHAAFDPLWKAKMARDGCSQTKARGAGYRWLAELLGIERRRCHIGMMDVATCARVVEICKRKGR